MTRALSNPKGITPLNRRPVHVNTTQTAEDAEGIFYLLNQELVDLGNREEIPYGYSFKSLYCNTNLADGAFIIMEYYDGDSYGKQITSDYFKLVEFIVKLARKHDLYAYPIEGVFGGLACFRVYMS